MIDLDELIEDARRFAEFGNGLNWQGRVRELADALESVRAERDQAQAELRDAFKTDIPSLRAERDAAESRIAEAAKLHRKHKHWNSDRECMFVCDECTRINRYGIAHWPCPTAVALGLNEGENEK